jgi:hypothetical protein
LVYPIVEVGRGIAHAAEKLRVHIWNLVRRSVRPVLSWSVTTSSFPVQAWTAAK